MTIASPTDVPENSLFNFQVAAGSEGELPIPYYSQQEPSIQITGATTTSTSSMNGQPNMVG